MDEIAEAGEHRGASGDRPPIPAELRRSVMTEAGHRCAIHTCRYPNADVHHIVPWSKCREHKAENLIALCPNCHRRADLGEIDAKSLRMYKARLVQDGNSRPGASHVLGETSIDQSWVVMRIAESASAPHPFKLELEFPKFLPDAGDLSEINAIQRGSALESLTTARAATLGDPPSPEDWWAGMEAVTIQSFGVTLVTGDLVSFRYEHYQFNPGAAHGNTATGVHNYARNPLVRVGLPELMRIDTGLEAFLSERCVRSLGQGIDDEEGLDWIRKGAGPALWNFQNFNATPHGLEISFDAYVVGSYADGIRRVFIERDSLRPFLKDGSPLTKAWRG